MPKFVFVHKYKYSHEKRKRQLNAARKKGLVKVVRKSDDGFLYEVPDDMKVFGTRG